MFAHSITSKCLANPQHIVLPEVRLLLLLRLGYMVSCVAGLLSTSASCTVCCRCECLPETLHTTIPAPPGCSYSRHTYACCSGATFHLPAHVVCLPVCLPACLPACVPAYLQ
jgi:hypothetical protein